MGGRLGGSRDRLLVGRGALALLAALAGCASPAASDQAAGWEGDSARYFNLSAGEAQIGVSSSDRGIVVRWRGPDGETWTEPEVVYDAGQMEWRLTRIRVGGPTLAMFATYSPPGTTYIDDDGDVSQEEWDGLDDDDVTVFVVCREGSCTASDPYRTTVVDAPQVTPDGRHVFLADIGDSYVTWHGDEIERVQPTRLPVGDVGDAQPLLAPDGSLRVVAGVPGAGGCSYTLSITAPDSAAYAEAATYQDPTDHRDRCVTALETFSPDYVVVSRSKYDVWFLARVGDRWRRVAEDPSGQVRYPRTGDPKLAGVYERSGFWHWREAVATSPDGRRLIVQMHFPGEERCGPPQVVARARPGERCVGISPMPTYTWGEEDPFYISLTCRSRPSPAADWVYSAPTAVTEDGRTWTTFRATESLRVGRDMVFRGHPTYRWSPDTGLRAVDLSTPRGSVLALLEDGSYARVGIVDARGGCEVEVRLAGADDSSWSSPVRRTAGRVPERFCSVDQVDTSGQDLRIYLGLSQSPDHWQVRLKWHDGEPVVEDGIMECFASDDRLVPCRGEATAP